MGQSEEEINMFLAKRATTGRTSWRGEPYVGGRVTCGLSDTKKEKMSFNKSLFLSGSAPSTDIAHE